jgi:hypothetical protein
MGRVLLLWLALAAAPQSTVPGYAVDLPDVPGAVNPQVTQDNIQETICKPGWTKTIRPPVSYTNKLKAQLMAEKHLPGKLGDYELDHDISLEIGGAPLDPNNLWMQPYAGKWGARTKDRIETLLKRLVCNGTIPLAEAQREISTDWVAAWLARIGNDSEAGK